MVPEILIAILRYACQIISSDIFPETSREILQDISRETSQ
jgi:hypothetical protein